MASTEWRVPRSVEPKPEDYNFDLERALAAVVGLRASVPADAFTAETLGTERAGNGVVIRDDGLVLTIGYLIAEAESLWLTLIDGRAVQGHVVAYDHETGFGLVQALGRLEVPPLRLGRSGAAKVGDPVVVAGAGGRHHSVAAHVVAKQEFAGYWEYVLEEAIFTAPAHPFWGGTAVIGRGGDLVGIGSLQLEHAREDRRSEHLNMVVPIDILKPVFEPLATVGRPNHPPRPWLGLYAAEVEGKIVVIGLAGKGPAERAAVRAGDIVLAVDGVEVRDLARFFRRVWSLGEAGVEVPLTIHREGRSLDLRVKSGDRKQFLKAPRLH